MRYAALFAGVGVVMALGACNVQASVAPGIDQRIERVCNDIPPAVVIEGERPKQTTLRALMAKLHVPGVSIAVIHDGKLAWARGFGIRDAAGDPVTPNTLFQAASISKPITALAALRLVDSGKLGLDADVNESLRSWKVPDSKFTAKRKVTLRELLSHTAGVTVSGFSGYGMGDPLPSLLQILNGQPPADNAPIRVDTVPGKSWRYSGGGYVIVRQLLEDVTGESFGELLQRSVLAPSGMAHSTFDEPLPAPLQAEAAVPHDRNGRADSSGAGVFPELAPDGLWTTPSDLARYAIQVQHALAGARAALITVQTARLMLTPVLNHYGLGVIVGDDPEHPWFTHNGGNYGFPCLFIAFENGDGAVIMSDGQNGFELEVDLLRSIAQEYDWPDFKPFRHRPESVGIETLNRYVGAYRMSANSFAVISREGGRLYLQTSLLGRQPVYPVSERDFIAEQGVLDYYLNRIDELKVEFTLDARDKAVGMTLKQRGSPQASLATRLEGTDANAVIRNMADINARFASQRPAAGGEASLRLMLQELARGTIRFPRVTPEFAEHLRSIVALNRHVFGNLGPVVSIAFRKVSPIGIDTYHVVFRNGEGEVDVALNLKGEIQYAQLQ